MRRLRWGVTGVNPFDDGDVGWTTFVDLELLAALRSSAEVRQLALRAFEPAREMRRWLARTIQDMPRSQSRRRPRRQQHAAPSTLPPETYPADDT